MCDQPISTMPEIVDHLFVFCAINAASAQPFGVEQGSSVVDLHPEKTDSKFVFYIQPLRTHPAFEKYLVNTTPETGICSILGIGAAIKNDAFGSETKSKFEDIVYQIESKYGSSKLYDFLNTKSIWKDQNEWSMSIYKNERTFARMWSVDEKSTLSNNVSSILIQVHALNSSDTYISLNFEFSNFKKCHAIIKNNEAGAF